jgi:hypothetical protein
MHGMELFTANGAAEFLNRDRRSVGKALRSVPPDSTEGGRPRWQIGRVSAALAKYDREWSGRFGRSATSDPKVADACDALMTATVEIEAAMARLRAEPDSRQAYGDQPRTNPSASGAPSLRAGVRFRHRTDRNRLA